MEAPSPSPAGNLPGDRSQAAGGLNLTLAASLAGADPSNHAARRLKINEDATQTIDLKPLVAGAIALADSNASQFVFWTGLSGIEGPGRWTDGRDASVTFVLPSHVDYDVIITVEARAFVWGAILPEQSVAVKVNGIPMPFWQMVDSNFRTYAMLAKREKIGKDKVVRIDFEMPNCIAPYDLAINPDRRLLGIMLRRITWRAAETSSGQEAWIWQLGRQVGGEARKSFDQKIESGFWGRYVNGTKVLDIGFKGSVELKGVVPITATAIGVDLDYPDYDGRTLPFDSESQDAVYSSHCLEHVLDYVNAIKEWYRVVRFGGHIITVVPHAHLYERRHRAPSKWNEDHKRFYTAASLLAEFEEALLPNSYRVRYLEENDMGYDYRSDPKVHPVGCYEVTLVIEKIHPPGWSVEGVPEMDRRAAADIATMSDANLLASIGTAAGILEKPVGYRNYDIDHTRFWHAQATAAATARGILPRR
jgi:predicted SAM-dependent methyltransferase